MPAPNTIAETGAAFLVVGAFAKVLPAAAALFAIMWYGIQIWQSETGRGWRVRWRKLLTFQSLTTEDRVAFVALGLAGAGVFLGMLAIGRIVQ